MEHFLVKLFLWQIAMQAISKRRVTSLPHQTSKELVKSWQIYIDCSMTQLNRPRLCRPLRLSDQLLELQTPCWGIPYTLGECLEFGGNSRRVYLTEGCNGPKRAALQLCSSLEILLDSVLGDGRPTHRFFEFRSGSIQPLCKRCRCHLRQSEKHHVA